MIKACVPLLLALLVAGCASGGAERTGSAVGQTATPPLSDLNIVRADIPAVLAAAQKAPYALPGDQGCAAIGAEVQALDAALGADLDTPATDTNPSLIERSANDALRRTAEGVIRSAAGCASSPARNATRAKWPRPSPPARSAARTSRAWTPRPAAPRRRRHARHE
jgi:hypothetical protein